MENSNSAGFTFDLPKGNSSIIKVIGVGGGGNNALKHMYERGIHGVDFIICNTDAQTLDNNPVASKVQLGVAITEGLGAGADPEVGEKAAIESIDEIKAALGQNTKMVFITAGMGGGTGTGAAPVVAKIAKEMGILTVGIVTVPFGFEGRRRLEQAEIGLEKLRNNVDSLIVINNDKLRQQFGNLGFKQGFSKADEVLTNAAKGMAEVITAPFQINIDFRDAKSVLQNSGTALMSTGIATGEKRAEEAVRKALDSPLLNDNKITGAKDVLLLILSGSDEASEATMDEIGLINDYVQTEAGGNNNANIIFGVGTDDELGDAIKVLVIATGFAKDNIKNQAPSETIRFSLNGDNKTERISPFQTSRKDAEPRRNLEDLGGKQFFRLDDEDEQPTPQFRSGDQEKKMTFVEETTSIVDFSDDFEEENHQNSIEKPETTNLFTYRNDEPDLEPEGFSFDTENSKKEEVKPSFENEKPVEFKFEIEEEQPAVDFGLREENTLPDPIFFPKIKNEIPEIKEEAQEFKQEIPAFEEKVPTFQEKIPAQETVKFEEEEEFTFITKKTENTDAKVMDRRNKLKEFNSRYQVSDENLEFENVPAYIRKNIAIEGGNASENHISSFYSERENGQVQIRENRFLNRDVD